MTIASLATPPSTDLLVTSFSLPSVCPTISANGLTAECFAKCGSTSENRRKEQQRLTLERPVSQQCRMTVNSSTLGRMAGGQGVVGSGSGTSGNTSGRPSATSGSAGGANSNGSNGHDGTSTKGKGGGDAAGTEHQLGELPAPRFGHTTTNVGSNKIVLFGGAIGDAGKYNITADTYLFDCATSKWTRLNADNAPPARAAHGSACVDSMQLVVYGGATGGGTLSSDELYLLDIRKSSLCWMIVPVAGLTPGRRYGHALTYLKPNVLLFGGNDGCRTMSDIWHMDVEQSPFEWKELNLGSTAHSPSARVYHSAEICREGPAAGMMVVFGGRGQDNKSLRDAWGLRQHRDRRWDWLEAPVKKGKLPDARYQHTSAFIGSKLVIIGGRADNDCTRSLPTALYDTETVEWRYLPHIARFRHSSWCIDSRIYAFGGFGHMTQHHPTLDLLFLDCTVVPSFYNELELEEMRRKQQLGSTRIGNKTAQAAALVGSAGSGIDVATPGSVSASQTSSGKNISTRTTPSDKVEEATKTDASISSLRSISSGRTNVPKPPTDIKLSSHAHAVHDTHEDFSSLVRRISIERLEDEGKKINKPAIRVSPSPSVPISIGNESVEDRIIRQFLLPNLTMNEFQRHFGSMELFPVSWEDIWRLCAQVLEIVKQDDMVLRLRAPIKVYGDIHGQFYDLMRLFRLYKAPVEEDVGDTFNIEGDIDSIDYLFLGDYVDRGANSLETICLLFALKCKYPRQLHLLRGNHEDPAINSVYGFQDECVRRLREDPHHENSCWNRFNDVFEYLPVGATIEDKVLCIHGGIGGSITKISQIAEMERPLKVAQVPTNIYQQRVTDLLWSDPTDNDSMLGVVPNDIRDPDGSGHIVKFGPDRVQQFEAENKISLIIRAHECVMDGFERFAAGKLITLFSATNYCDHHHNAGALLFIKRDLTVVPKLIYPAEAQYRFNTWDQRMTELRPPTPPRTVPKMRETEFA